MSIPGVISADTRLVLRDLDAQPGVFMGTPVYPTKIVHIIPEMAHMEASLADPSLRTQTIGRVDDRIAELNRRVDDYTQSVANYRTAASAAMTALTDSDDDMENAGEFANEEERYQTWSADSMESKLNVLRQALGHYKDIRTGAEQTGHGIGAYE